MSPASKKKNNQPCSLLEEHARLSTGSLHPLHRPCMPHRIPGTTPQRRGVVVIIMLLALIALTGLVIYVLNLGQQVNNRIETQHSADSGAVAGAGWVARSLNTVAMNNVAMARSIAMINVLDSMPQVVNFSHLDVMMIHDSFDAQLQRGIIDPWVRDAFINSQSEIDREIAELQPLYDFFSGPAGDVQPLTVYNGPNGRGRIWQAMEALDEMSQVTLETMGSLAQLNTVRGGEVNLARLQGSGGDDVSLAMLVPATPAVPWVRGTFNDFKRPVMNGLLPVGVDDKVTNRGPYDTIFGWRNPRAGKREGYYQGPDSIATRGQSNVPIGSGVRNEGRFITTGREAGGYTVFGPYQWMLRRINGWAGGNMPFSRMGYWNNQINNIKINYLWNGSANMRELIRPNWVIDFPTAKDLGDTTPSEIVQTAFAVVEIKSRYRANHPLFMSDGSWRYVRSGRTMPRIVYRNGWMDPTDWPATKVGDYIWRDEWDYNVYYDSTIGITEQRNGSTDELIPQPVYRVDTFVFLGVNTGKPEDVSNPYNFGSTAQLPAPIDLNHSMLPPSYDARRHYLTYLAAARRPNTSHLWQRQFNRERPSRYMVALAEVEVFNNHSWDLWTQAWHAQLRPVTDYNTWLARMEDDTFDTGSDSLIGNVPSFSLGSALSNTSSGSGMGTSIQTASNPIMEDVYEYLRNAAPLAEVMLAH